MIEVYILSAALVAAGAYINFLTWRMGKMETHLENANLVLMAMMEDERNGN